MKLLPFYILLFLSVETYSQPHDYTERLQPLTYPMTLDTAYTLHMPNGTRFLSYETRDNTLLKPGDTLVVSQPATRGTFDRLYEGRIVTKKGLNTSREKLPSGYAGHQLQLSDIMVYHTTSYLASSVVVLLQLRKITSSASEQFVSVVDYESAHASGEILELRSRMSPRAKLAKLMMYRILLDEGKITKATYDSMRLILDPPGSHGPMNRRKL